MRGWGSATTDAMMVSSSAPAMAPYRPSRLLQSCAGLAVLLGLGARAETYVPFPSQDSLRQVQLAALACARENTAASCDQARKLADPLLDHPRLPAACKDQAWAIREKAQPAASNSFGRREAIGQAAELLMLSCRSSEKPLAPAPQPDSSKPSGGGGLRFGGGR